MLLRTQAHQQSVTSSCMYDRSQQHELKIIVVEEERIVMTSCLIHLCYIHVCMYVCMYVCAQAAGY